MGVEYSAKLVVGLPSQEMEDQYEDGYYDQDGELEHVPSYYDGDSGVVGIVVQDSGDYDYCEVDLDKLKGVVEWAVTKFNHITGKQGKLYLCTHGF